jgi:glycosyltransferase involved in cell wall biosynthesis
MVYPSSRYWRNWRAMNPDMSDDSVSATVLIPVRNGAKYLPESIESCTSQISKYDFEILVVNDQSDDLSFDVAADYSARFCNVRVLNSPFNGVGSALQFGIENARGKYVLRLDSDDRMKASRIDEQISYMEDNPNLVLLGSQISLFGEPRPGMLPNVYPQENMEILTFMEKGNAFADPSVIFRRDAALSIRPIKNYLNGAEQYDFWLRLSLLGTVSNSESVLTEYRVHSHQFTRARTSKVFFSTVFVQILWILGISQMQTALSIRQKNFVIQRHRVSKLKMTWFLLVNFRNQTVAWVRHGI